MKSWRWIAYGLDMETDILIDMPGKDMADSHKKAHEELIRRNLTDWDCLELAKDVQEAMERRAKQQRQQGD